MSRMDLQFIKKEEPVDYSLIVTEEDQIAGLRSVFIATDDVNINIKQEPGIGDFDRIVTEDNVYGTVDSKDYVHNNIKQEPGIIVTEENELPPLANDFVYEITEIKPIIANTEYEDCFEDNKHIAINQSIGRTSSANRNTGSKRKDEFKCVKCNFITNKKFIMTRHAQRHEQPDIDQCKICLRFFPIAVTQFHMESHDGPPYTCKICSKIFSIRRSWYQHRFVHDTEELYECDICGKYLRSKKTILEHLLAVHLGRERKKEFECKICGAYFFRETTLNRHVGNIHRSQAHRCSNTSCNRFFMDKNSLETHKCRNFSYTNAGNQPWNRFECDKCKKIFYKLHIYVMHVQQNCSDILMYECNYCSKLFPRKDMLVTHFMYYHKFRQRNYMYACHLCSRTFRKNTELEHHLRRCCFFQTEEERAINAHKCDKCGKTFKKYDLMVLHVAQHCCDKIMYECDYCSKPFRYKNILLQHFGGYHNIRELKHESCPICNKSFYWRGKLRLHLKLHENKLFECKYCNRTFARSFAHKAHLKRCTAHKSIDKSNDKFKCDICDYVFLRKSYIVEHMQLVHSLESKSRTDQKHRLTCSFCKTSLKNKLLLRLHIRRMHGDSRTPLTCNYCIKSFFNEKKYMKHIKVQNCRKNIQCAICARTFSNNNRLRKHLNCCTKTIFG